MSTYCNIKKWLMRITFLLIAINIAVSGKGQIDTENVLLLGRNAVYFDDYLTAIHYFNQAIEAKPYLTNKDTRIKNTVIIILEVVPVLISFQSPCYV